VTPTGNFGNILAGYFAKQMGLPVAKLVGKLFSLPCYHYLASFLTQFHSGDE
jgi:hypothetical protein